MNAENLPSPIGGRAPVVRGMPALAPTLQEYAMNLVQQSEVARIMYVSGICPKSYKTPEMVLVAVWYGGEIGFSPVQSVQSIDVIDGRAGVNAAGLMALCRSKGGRFEVVEHNEDGCTVRGYRGDEVATASFSLSDARRADLLGKDNWRKYPLDMLFARAVSRVIRRLFADVIRGLQTTEELRDGLRDDDETPSDAGVSAAPHPSDSTATPAPAPRLYHYRPKAEWSDIQKAAAKELFRSVNAREDTERNVWESKVELPRIVSAYVSPEKLDAEKAEREAAAAIASNRELTDGDALGQLPTLEQQEAQ